MTDSTDDHAAKHALETSSKEYIEIDVLLIKLATFGLGFSVALDAYQEGQRTGWLFFSWISLLFSASFVLVSKYLSVEALRAFYLSREHQDSDTRQKYMKQTERLDKWIKWTNWIGGSLFFVGALFLVLHVVPVR